MSTNATISVVTKEGVYTVYNHWDGYPDYLLKMLTENYNDLRKATELVKNGDISVVKERCDGDGAHTFNNPIPGQTIYYGRDRGEKGTAPAITPLEEFKTQGAEVSTYGRQEYNYVYANGQWMHEAEFLAELDAEGETQLIENVLKQLREDIRAGEDGAVYELIESLYLECGGPAVEQAFKNYLPNV